MKVLETLLFMFRNPIPLIVHLTCWFLLAAWGIVSDDPFIEGRWRYVELIASTRYEWLKVIRKLIIEYAR